MDAIQTDLFSTGPVDTVAEEAEETWTNDLVALVDVPLPGRRRERQRVQRLPQRIDGQVVYKPGLINHRQAPHPTRAIDQRSGQVIDVSGMASDERARRTRPLMTLCTIQTTFDQGVTTDRDLEVLWAVLALWRNRYLSQHQSSATIETTRSEILTVLGRNNAGAASAEVIESLQRFGGITILKIYHPPADGAPGAGEVKGETKSLLFGLISALTIDDSVLIGGDDIEHEALKRQNLHRGRRAGRIAITLNPQLVEALKGGAPATPVFSVRDLSLTKALSYTQSWARQLFRIVDTRLERSGHFTCPLPELWADALGMDLGDLFDATKLARVRYKIRQQLRKWEEVGYITLQNSDEGFERRRGSVCLYSHRWQGEVETPDRPAPPDNGRAATAYTSTVTNAHQREHGVPLAVTAHRIDETEWVTCRVGPAFDRGRPTPRKDFFRELMLAAGFGQEATERYLASRGLNAVRDVYVTFKRLITDILQEDLSRFDMDGWFAPLHPRLDEAKTINRACREEHGLRVSERDGIRRAPVATRLAVDREALLRYLARENLRQAATNAPVLDPAVAAHVPEADRPLVGLFEHLLAQGRGEGAIHRMGRIYRRCRSRMLDREDLPESRATVETFITDRRLARACGRAYAMAARATIVAGGRLLWVNVHMDRLWRAALPEDGGGLPRDLLRQAVERWPAALEIVRNLREDGDDPWALRVAALAERRLLEAVVEQRELEAKSRDLR